jgi:hypothetical protein
MRDRQICDNKKLEAAETKAMGERLTDVSFSRSKKSHWSASLTTKIPATEGENSYDD